MHPIAPLNLTCLFSVIALGWHFVQIPPGHGGCSVHPGLIRQLVSSSTVNLPLFKRWVDNSLQWQGLKHEFAIHDRRFSVLEIWFFHAKLQKHNPFTNSHIWYSINKRASMWLQLCFQNRVSLINTHCGLSYFVWSKNCLLVKRDYIR